MLSIYIYTYRSPEVVFSVGRGFFFVGMRICDFGNLGSFPLHLEFFVSLIRTDFVTTILIFAICLFTNYSFPLFFFIMLFCTWTGLLD